MGLIVNVYRVAGRDTDCTNGGVSSKFDTLTLVNVDGPFEPKPDRPAAILQKGRLGSINIVPATDEGEPLPGWFMFGGNLAATSDSRFHEAVRKMTGGTHTGGVNIHDRQEW